MSLDFDALEAEARAPRTSAEAELPARPKVSLAALWRMSLPERAEARRLAREAGVCDGCLNRRAQVDLGDHFCGVCSRVAAKRGLRRVGYDETSDAAAFVKKPRGAKGGGK